MIGTRLAATADPRRLDHREPAILVMGNEQAGLSKEMAAACDTPAKLPMAGHADSLNLAIARGIALFEVRRGGWGEGVALTYAQCNAEGLQSAGADPQLEHRIAGHYRPRLVGGQLICPI